MEFSDKQKFQQYFWTGWEEGSGGFSGAIGKDNTRALEGLKSSLWTAVGKQMYLWLTETLQITHIDYYHEVDR